MTPVPPLVCDLAVRRVVEVPLEALVVFVLRVPFDLVTGTSLLVCTGAAG